LADYFGLCIPSVAMTVHLIPCRTGFGLLNASSTKCAVTAIASFATGQVGCRFMVKARHGLERVTPSQHPRTCHQNRKLDMNNLALGCREIEALCRQRAISDRTRSWKWLGEADRWRDLAHREIAFRFQNNQMHAGSMAMGPNTIAGDSHRQKHESIQRLQSVMRGG
jgi:hypothetical protein